MISKGQNILADYIIFAWLLFQIIKQDLNENGTVMSSQ